MVHHRFEEQAERTPHAIAVVCGAARLTYRGLDRRANQLAHHLRGLGVGPDVLVGVYLERSLDLLVALLGVLKAGGAYLPLDTSHPKERIAFMVDAARVVLTERRLVAGLPEHRQATVCLVDATEIAGAPVTRPSVAIDSDHLAYAIYTSGSTGEPKGVAIPHRGLANLVAWHLRAFGVTAADRASQVASFSFDASVWEIWPYLAAGAELHLADEPTRKSPPDLLAWLCDQRITIAFLPTPMAEAVLRLEWPAAPSLRILLTGGDALHRSASQKLPFRLVNNYGPTESSVVATSGDVDGTIEPPPIGRPIDHTQVYLLDAQLAPTPVGVAGELYIGGDGLARGYLDRPDLTADRFGPNPFSLGRMYRTGDRARWLADGNIEFLGRVDHQVKIRGHRIELGEIESVLVGHPALAEAVVVARTDGGELRLVAYVVPRQAPGPKTAELRARLAARLPEYMVPAAFVELSGLPLTQNGKVDRNALPAPYAARPEGSAAYVAPRGPTEERLAVMWGELFRIDRVGVDDDFFELGGHSLLATSLLSRVQAELGVQMPSRTLFDAPTISGFAAQIERSRTEAPSPAPLRIRRQFKPL